MGDERTVFLEVVLAGADEGVERAGDASDDLVVPDRLQGRGGVDGARCPQLLDDPSPACRVGLVPHAHVALDEAVESGGVGEGGRGHGPFVRRRGLRSDDLRGERAPPTPPADGHYRSWHVPRGADDLGRGGTWRSTIQDVCVGGRRVGGDRQPRRSAASRTSR